MQFTRAIMGFCVLGAISATSSAQTPLTSEWTYQGALDFEGTPLNETVDLQFTLWDADTSGNQVGTTLSAGAVPVVDGRFTVALDFGTNAFNGDARWLEIAVARTDAPMVSLSPRQPLTVAPYALQTRGFVMDQFGSATVGPSEDNRATGLHSTVSGGVNNEASGGATVSGGSGNRALGASTIAGGSSNTITVLGGRSTISGGRSNTSSGEFGVIGGGEGNSVTDLFALVAGGEENVASNRYAAVGGGRNNTASGFGAVVPGGESNIAAQNYTFAGGRNAQANHVGSFVWAADSLSPFQSTDIRQFLISAEKGVGINTNDPQSELDVNGTVTATTFVGDGSGLTDLPAPATSNVQVIYGNGLEVRASPAQLDQENPAGPNAVGGLVTWQSFTAGVSGELIAVEVQRVVGAPAGEAVVNLYAGEGTGGALLGSSSIPPTSTPDDWHQAHFPATIPVSSGSQYTIELVTTVNTRWKLSSANPYPGGRGSDDPSRDYVFRTYVVDPQAEFATAFVVHSSGQTGIGRQPTTNTLEVEGNASKSTAGDWLANSDRRIKTNIETVSDALDTLDRVRLVSFEYTDDYKANHAGVGGGRYLNVIAQEFAEIFPDHVKGSGERLPDGSEILQVDTYPLTIYSAAAIQELRAEKDAEIAALQQSNDRLAASNADLAHRLAKLETMIQQMAAK